MKTTKNTQQITNPTPGKWEIIKVPDRCHWQPIDIYAVEDGNHKIITVEPIGSVPEQMANACLVIGAADLLTELQLAVLELAGYAAVSPSDPPAWFQKVHQTKYDVMAKAQGFNIH